MSDPIKKIGLGKLDEATGKYERYRYRFVIDIGRDPETGKRRQKTHTLDTLREARAEYARISHEVGRGVYVAPANKTLSELIDDYLSDACRDVEAGTASNYRHALQPARERLGERRAQALLEKDIDALVDWMLSAGRKRGGKPGTGLSARTVSLTLGQLRAVLNLGVRRQMLVRNVAAFTKIPRSARKAAAEKRAARRPWAAEETQTFLAAISHDRLYAPVLLAAMGLRPAETCGLPESEVCLETNLKGVPPKYPMIRVEVTRTLVDGQAVEKGPKSAAGKRTLPLPEVATAALKAFRRRKAVEKLAAGEAYTSSGKVLVDELGRPFKTDQFRRYLYKLMREAGVRQVTPYDMRHSCLTYLATNGVSDVVVSAWAGHADLSLAKRVYVHPDASHLEGAATALNVLLSGTD
jgi:integrase